MTIAPSPPLQPPAGEARLPECPYVGLVPFREQEAPFFFGREREAETIVANLTAARLTLLYAPSGVGKSSVLRAGVLPVLRRLAAEDADDEIAPAVGAVVYVSDWSTHPLEAAGTAIRQAVAEAVGTAEAPTETSSRLGLDWLRGLLDDTGVSLLYLILDQFEEYFFYHPDDAGEDSLDGELSGILSARDMNVHVLLSVREDALAGVDRFKGRVPHLFGNYLRLAHLDRDAGRTAIEGPLGEYDRRVDEDRAMSAEPDLVEDILDQVRTGQVIVDADATSMAGTDAVQRGLIEAPYLQLVLTRIWEHEVAQGSHVLQRATLVELGGAQTIVQSHLDTVVAGLAPEQVPVAAAVFHHLVTASGSKIALTAMDLADWSGQPDAEVTRLLESLASGPRRILRPVPPVTGTSGPRRYEIFHDVMGTAVLEWRRQYVAEEHLRETNQRLITEREQARAETLTARRRLRLVVLSISLVVVLLLAAVLGWSALRQANAALQQLQLTEAATSLDRNPQTSMSKAVQAYGLDANSAARSAVLSAASAPRSTIVVGPEGANGAITLTAMKVTADGSHAVGFDRDAHLVVVGPDGRKQTDVQVAGLRGAAVDIAVAPDASRIAVCTDRGEVTVVDVPSGQRVDLATGLFVGSEIYWLGQGSMSTILVLGADRSAVTFDATTGAAMAKLPGPYYWIAPLNDGSHVVTSPYGGGSLQVWDATNGAVPVAQSETFETGPGFLAQDDTKILGVSSTRSPRDGAELVIWDWRAGTPAIRTPLYHRNAVQSLAVNTVLHTVLVGFDKNVQEYSNVTGEISHVLPQQSDWPGFRSCCPVKVPG